MRYIEYQESRKHGTFDFPFALYKVNRFHPRYIMTYHWHSETEIIRVLSGQFPITLNGSEYFVSPGECIFIPSGILHGGTPKNCTYECLVFNLEAVTQEIRIGRQEIQQLTNHDIQIESYYPADCVDILMPVNAIFQAIGSREDGYPLIVQGNLCILLGNILRHHYYHAQQDTSHHIKKRIHQYKTVLAFIETHYAEPLTLGDLAGCVHMNSRYFCRFFKDLTHQSPIDYLNSYRIEAACEQLSTKDKSITEIALDCGFNDASYFVKVFKKYKNMTPSKYLYG